MQLFSADAVTYKIKEFHDVDFVEVEEAFFNHDGAYLIDDRKKNKTNPPTVWFISETFAGRLLKVVIIPIYEEGIAILRTAYEPDQKEIELYDANS